MAHLVEGYFDQILVLLCPTLAVERLGQNSAVMCQVAEYWDRSAVALNSELAVEQSGQTLADEAHGSAHPETDILEDALGL